MVCIQYTSKCVLRVCWSGRCQLSRGMIRLWRSEEAVVEEVLVQQAAIFFCTISCSIIVLWITSIAGDNRQAAKRTGWYRTPTPVWEAVWIISCLPADCLWGLGASDGWEGVCVGWGGGDSVRLYRWSGWSTKHIQDYFCESYQFLYTLYWILLMF